MMLSRPLALIGMMGAGKSSLGRRLGLRLNVPFTDADDEIVRQAGKAVAEIFETEGEASFRMREREVLRDILTDHPVGVLATGGGAFMDPETRMLILQRSVTIWLRAPLDILVERTGRRDDRPLLKTGNPREILARLMWERESTYALAHVVVDMDDRPPDETVERLLDAATEYLERNV